MSLLRNWLLIAKENGLSPVAVRAHVSHAQRGMITSGAGGRRPTALQCFTVLRQHGTHQDKWVDRINGSTRNRR